MFIVRGARHIARSTSVGTGRGLFLLLVLALVSMSACQLPFDSSSGENSAVDAEETRTTDETAETALQEEPDTRPIRFEFAVVADSHSDHEAYPQVLAAIKATDADFILHLGDLTRVGGIDELAEAKAELEATGLPYYVIPGDHDIVRSGGVDYFEAEYGPAYQQFDFEGVQFILLNNADLESGIAPEQFTWLEQNLSPRADVTFVALHNPPTHTLFKMHTMDENPISAAAARQLFDLLAPLPQPYVLAGELHLFSTYQWDRVIPITVAGAAGVDRNPGGPMYLRVIVRGDYDPTVEIESVKLTSES